MLWMFWHLLASSPVVASGMHTAVQPESPTTVHMYQTVVLCGPYLTYPILIELQSGNHGLAFHFTFLEFSIQPY